MNDNCHSLGAAYFKDKQYAVNYADVVTQSFHPVKHITTGEGGAVMTNDQKLIEKVRLLRSHGTTKDSNHLENNDGPWYYEMHMLGFNYRITDFQCALGSNQLKKLNSFIKIRVQIAFKYDKAFEDIDVIKIPKKSDNIQHAYHLYPILIDFERIDLKEN